MTRAKANKRNIVVIGASAGGVPLLRKFLENLPAKTGASYFIVIHRGAVADSDLVGVLGRQAKIDVREPEDGDRIVRDTAYLASPDLHMRIGSRVIHVDRGPKEHHTRPAIDPLFVSAAECHGARTIGVLLSGNLSDGVAGLVAVKAAGGLSIVQDPREAEWPSMPRNALLYDHVDLVFESALLPGILERLVRGETVASVTNGAT